MTIEEMLARVDWMVDMEPGLRRSLAEIELRMAVCSDCNPTASPPGPYCGLHTALRSGS